MLARDEARANEVDSEPARRDTLLLPNQHGEDFDSILSAYLNGSSALLEVSIEGLEVAVQPKVSGESRPASELSVGAHSELIGEH